MQNDPTEPPQDPDDRSGQLLLWASIIGAAAGCVMAFMMLAGTYGPNHINIGGTFLAFIVFGALGGAVLGTVIDSFRE